MHEPAACAARPAQQASVHSGPLAAAGKTMLPATSVSNSIVASTALAAIVAVLANSPHLPELAFCCTTPSQSVRSGLSARILSRLQQSCNEQVSF
jgi:hypothetical protein